MVIDDERMILTSVRRMLGKEHEVSGFESAGPALERLRSGAVYDVILCDLMMPGISGMEFRRLLGELDSALLPRLVFMSGGAFTPDIRTFADAAGAALVDKPFDNATLRSVVNRLLK